jgi:hypothetical protein
MGVMAISAITWFAAAGALSVVILVLIVAAPWRRVRSESRRLDRDVETRLLLGEDPDELADELDERAPAPSPVADLRPDERP